MSFKSYKQQAYMFAKHPKIAKKWAKEYGTKKKPKGYKPGPKLSKMAKKARNKSRT